MFGSQILDVAIGLIFVYLLLGLLCSVINEWIASIFSLRSRTLEAGIRNLLKGKDPQGKELVDSFYNHPLIKGLYRQETKKRPSYIPSRTFAQALMDVIAPPKETGLRVFKDLRETVLHLPDDDVKTSLLLFMDDAEENIGKVRKNIEEWFDNAMDRVSGWYKRKTQLITLVVALVVTIGLNADSFTIANSLYRDPVLSASIVEAAAETAKQPLPARSGTRLTRASELQAELQQVQLPIGWLKPSEKHQEPQEAPSDVQSWLFKILGWLGTVFAVSLGAPFWFDVLKKLVNLRSTGNEPEKSSRESKISPVSSSGQ